MIRKDNDILIKFEPKIAIKNLDSEIATNEG